MRLPQAIHHEVIPAQMGWTILLPPDDEAGQSSGAGVYSIPVIAWHVQIFSVSQEPGDTFCSVIPITPAGTIEEAECALQYDGKAPLFTQFGEYDSVTAWLADRKPRARQ
jgi:hypothetical protein